jgi:hypothetical protein
MHDGQHCYASQSLVVKEFNQLRPAGRGQEGDLAGVKTGFTPCLQKPPSAG